MDKYLVITRIISKNIKRQYKSAQMVIKLLCTSRKGGLKWGILRMLLMLKAIIVA
jgi:hypothetical protein